MAVHGELQFQQLIEVMESLVMARCVQRQDHGEHKWFELQLQLQVELMEGDKEQDGIDFEFLGKGMIQTNVYTEGKGNREEVHQLEFDSG